MLRIFLLKFTGHAPEKRSNQLTSKPRTNLTPITSNNEQWLLCLLSLTINNEY